MRLSDDPSSIDLRPLRYQFPTVMGDTYDDNWLVIGGSVPTPHGSWSFTTANTMRWLDADRRV